MVKETEPHRVVRERTMWRIITKGFPIAGSADIRFTTASEAVAKIKAVDPEAKIIIVR